jgi:hypothetical protein
MSKKVIVSPKNTKLGNIPSFSLPSITSCPGATKECKKVCYAAKIERVYKNAAKAYEINMNAINDKNFIVSLAEEITKLVTKKKNAPTTFRWHVSGDIKDIKYLNSMQQVMTKFPEVTFYAYTRNWSLPNWGPHLDSIKKLSNFTLFASVDDEHINNGILPGNEWRIAYFGSKTQQEIAMLTNKKTITCPNQVNKTKTILCDTCQYCFNPKLMNTTQSVYFIRH